MTFAEHMMNFYRGLVPPSLPGEVQALLPFQDDRVRGLMNEFYQKYYNDERPRLLLFGINPGRLGAGMTGIGFTDPIRLSEVCGIDHHMDMKPETSSVFIYKMIEAYGGPDKFFAHFHFSSVSPIGYIQNGKNVNYYDTPDLMKCTEQFVIDSMQKQLRMPVHNSIAFSIGKGKNLKVLEKINREFDLFSRIGHLPHPRWVMQYRYRKREDYIDEYLQKLSVAADQSSQ